MTLTAFLNAVMMYSGLAGLGLYFGSIMGQFLARGYWTLDDMPDIVNDLARYPVAIMWTAMLTRVIVDIAHWIN